MELLKATGLSKSFAIESGIFRSRTGTVTAIDDVSLTLDPAQVIGVVGESGSGKTTLGRVLTGLLKPDRGSVLIEGADIRSLSRRDLAARIQMVFQDPFASLNPKLTVGTMLSEAASFLPGPDRESAVAATLEMVGLSASVLPAYPHQFSGGQRQRIAIARALIRKPRVIVADEPLSALDVSVQNQLLDVFLNLKRQHAVSFIFISHDLAATSNLADYLLVMKDGRVVEEGTAAAVIACPQNDYTRRLLAAVPAMDITD
jgi:ABC-type glutathione transport system ATPase component